MEGMLVSASQGVVDYAVSKFANLIGDTCANLMGLPDDILTLSSSLHEMKDVLEELEDNDKLNPQMKNLRNQMRELTYDIEDSVDDYKNNVRSADAKASLLMKLVSRIRLTWMGSKHVRGLKTRLQEVDRKRQRFRGEYSSSSTTIEPLDPRLAAFYNEADSLVGIENPKEELIRMVNDDTNEQLKVICIVGSGGLGKTTLANEVYRGVGREFRKAIVSVSRSPDKTMILNSLLSQLFGRDQTSHICDAKNLIDKLRKYLHNKRYLILVDDLWDVPPWHDTIQYAFPRNNRGSRVIVTTRQMDVARACCSDNGYIYPMKPLTEANSKKLFWKRLAPISEDEGDSHIICEILKKCGGLPLAIITISSFLACQRRPLRLKEQWEFIQNSLTNQPGTSDTLDNMVDILELSYKSLPGHLKTCFLYLGTFPEDRKIYRDELVRKWVAEGFVDTSSGRDVWHVAEENFNMLVNRSMIQPGFDAYNTRKVYCRVHDLMLDLIILKRCEDNNLVTVIRDPHKVGKGQYRVRRLSVDLGGGSVDGSMRETSISQLSHARSIAIFGGSGWMPPLLEFKYLRVLFLEFQREVDRIDLTSIIQLSQLRYLKVSGEPYYYTRIGSIELPGEIGRLQHLETMELDAYRYCSSCPSDIIDLPRLSHLELPFYSGLPDRIGKMTSLRTLRGLSLAMSSSENIENLGELTSLEGLWLHGSYQLPCTVMAPSTWMDALSACLGNLSNLKWLTIVSSSDTYCRGDALSSLSPTFFSLERLFLLGVVFSRVPRWISDLHELYTLCLVVDEISNSSWQDIGIIGALRSLVYLRLEIPGVPAERIVIAGSTGFAALQDFEFNCDGLSYLTFEEGAMPNLRSLQLYFDPREWNEAPPNGLQHLSSLEQITATKAGVTPTENREEVEQMKDAVIREVLGAAANALPTRPAFTLYSGWVPRGQ